MKKYLSIFIVLTMMLTTLCIPVNASDSASENVITYFDGILYDSGLAKQVAVDANTFFGSGSTVYTKRDDTQYEKRTTISVHSSGSGKGVKWTTENDNNYLVVNWSHLRWSYYTALTDYMTTATPVMSFSYDMRIPAESSNTKRKTSIQFSSNPASGTNDSSSIIVNYDNGVFSVSTSAITDVNSNTASYTPGSNWVNIDVRAYLTTNNTINVGVYVDENQIYYGTGTADYTDGFGIRRIDFDSDVMVDSGATTIYDAHMDEIKISTLPESYKPTEIVEEVVPVENALSLFDGVVYTKKGSETEQDLQTKGEFLESGKYFYPTFNSSKINSGFVLRASTGTGSGIKWVTENGNDYYVVNWTHLRNGYYNDLSGYLTTDTPVLSFSYDICIPAESSTVARRTNLLFSSDPVNGKSIGEDVVYSDLNLYVDYNNGAFSVSTDSDLANVSSKTASYSAGDWVNVDIRAYRTEENKISIGVYVGDEQIYFGTHNDDYSNNFGIRLIDFTSDSAVDTYMDDIKIDAVSSEYKPEPVIQLFLDYDEESASVVSKAKINDGSSLCLVTAVFDNYGRLVDLWTDTTLENGILTYTVSGSGYIKSGYEVKAFLFDSLQSAIPQIESENLIIE